jgi:hypothetical protein
MPNRPSTACNAAVSAYPDTDVVLHLIYRAENTKNRRWMQYIGKIYGHMRFSALHMVSKLYRYIGHTAFRKMTTQLSVSTVPAYNFRLRHRCRTFGADPKLKPQL